MVTNIQTVTIFATKILATNIQIKIYKSIVK